MATEREELERLRKLKRLKELEAKAQGMPIEQAIPEQVPTQSPFSQMLQQAQEQVPAVLQPGLQAAQAIPQVFEKGGEAVAETLAGPGLTMQPALGVPGLPAIPRPAEEGEEAIRTSPEVAAGIGTAIQMAPDIATSLVGGGVGVAGKRAATEALKKAFTIKGIGAEIGAAERAAGVVQRIPTTRGLAESLQLPAKSNFSIVANNVDTALTQGSQLPKQFLADFRKAAEAALKQPTFAPGTSNRAILLQIKQKADDAFNMAIPGRQKLSTRFKSAKKREQLLESLGRGVKKAGKVAAIGTIGGGTLAGLSNLFGK